MRRLCHLLFLSALLVSAKDTIDWKQGRLVEVSVKPPISALATGLKVHRVFTYSIDGGESIYQARETARRTVVELNALIQYSVAKDRLLVKDADGKVHQLVLIQTARKR